MSDTPKSTELSRAQAEIELLLKEQEKDDREIERLNAEVERLRKENLELEAAGVELAGDIERLNAKIERPLIGWLCPACGRGNAPTTPTCPCRDSGTGYDTTERKT